MHDLFPHTLPTPRDNKQARGGAFHGTDNPRHHRALHALLRGPITRHDLDHFVGCENGPALVADLRELGLAIPCEKIPFRDRDGRACHPGVYSFTNADRKKVKLWLTKSRIRRGPG